MRLREKFNGDWKLTCETKKTRKDGIETVEKIYHPVIDGKVESWAFNPGSGRQLYRKTWIAKKGDKISGEHSTRKQAIAEIS